MSECVVRMEMPENCCECQLRQEGYEMGEEFCPFTGVECLSIGRQNNCPIICSLPEGHGRLGDLDALTRLMLERKQPLVGADSSKDRYRYMQWLADFNAIKDVKTVVPAERNGAEQV